MSAPAGSNCCSSAFQRSTSASALARASIVLSLDIVRLMADLLVYADTFRSPELRHEVPLGIPDPFLYAEKDGRRIVVVSSMEAPRLGELGLFEIHPWDEFGMDELRASGRTFPEIEEELQLRAVEALGITAAAVPVTFPLWLADALRARGVELTVDRSLFDERRRVKSES